MVFHIMVLSLKLIEFRLCHVTNDSLHSTHITRQHFENDKIGCLWYWKIIFGMFDEKACDMTNHIGHTGK